MIPGKIVRFLEQHANLAFAGTRDRDRVPYGHRVSGWHVNVSISVVQYTETRGSP